MRDTLVVLLTSLSMPSMPSMPLRRSCVAVVGGGITGACAASVLAKHFEQVLVFDQGQRGPGGRASHRSVDRASGEVLQDDNIEHYSETFQFDHGCQFFRADSEEMSSKILQEWISKGWVAPWDARLGCIKLLGDLPDMDFFGVPARAERVYVGVGGMHMLPRKILHSSGAQVHRGTRVSSVHRKGDRWELRGTKGVAAYHDTKESTARQEAALILAEADAVVFTDISSASESWHRASAGIPRTLRELIPEKARLPLFTCMVALSEPVSGWVPFDGFTVGGGSHLWFAARSQSKPGFPQNGAECWTLVSTAAFAAKQISETTMRDPVTGEFRPQENNYLNTVPGPALFNAFLDAVNQYLPPSTSLPKAIFLQGQRWGSGLPIPEDLVGRFDEILGTKYCSELKSSLVFERSFASASKDYIADDLLQLYYAGDFCSFRNPGFEAAALSGVHVANHIVDTSLD
jgi:predicted NAD/FAD-dependent oxidoreductase